MRFPDFLIIGAMKAGTTTLYYDLMANPSIYLPAENKEPHSLGSEKVLTAGGRREYARYFAKARANQVCGEASTGYTKLPTARGVPERAMAICGPSLKLIYLVREPVSRIISHHRHDSAPPAHAPGQMDPDIDVAFERHPELVEYSRYAMQIEPWIARFGRERVHIVVFEEYIRDRRAVVAAVSEFLGVEPRPDLVDVNARWNASDSRPVVVGGWKWLYNAPVYRRAIRPRIPLAFRNYFRETILPRHEFRPAPPSPSTVERVLTAVQDDAEALRRLLGRSEPVWDFDAVRAKFGCNRVTTENRAAS